MENKDLDAAQRSLLLPQVSNVKKYAMLQPRKDLRVSTDEDRDRV